MRRSILLLLLLLVSCGGSDDNPADPGSPGVETPKPLEYTYLNRLPQPDNLAAISEFSGRAVAVGSGGAIVIREQGSSDWRRVEGPTRSEFLDVVMVDAQVVLATAIDGTYLSRDGGVTWKRVDTTQSMRKIAVQGGRAIIGGRLGIIFSTNFEDWEPATATPSDLFDMGFAGDDIAWAMNRDSMYRSEDGGKTWVEFITRSVGAQFAAFAFAEENFGTLARTDGEVLSTTNGTTFSFLRDVGSNVVDVDFLAGGLGVMVTRDLNVFTSDSRGKSWAFRDGLDIGFLPSDIELTDAGEVLVVGLEGLIVESTGSISTLRELSSGIGDDLGGVAFRTPSDGLAYDERFEADLFRTPDGGRSWEPIASPVARVAGIAFHADGFALLLTRTGDVLRSDDFGDNWVDTGASSEAQMSCLFISDRDTWMAGGIGFIAHTDDAGANWSLTPVEPRVTGIDRFPGTDVVLGVGNGLVRSLDGGATWSDPDPVPAFVNGLDVACIDESTAVLVGGDIYRTTDQGITWENILDVDNEFHSVVFLDATHGVAAGDRGMIMETLDGGLTWTELEIVAEDLKAITRRGTGSVIIVGEDGVVIDGSMREE